LNGEFAINGGGKDDPRHTHVLQFAGQVAGARADASDERPVRVQRDWTSSVPSCRWRLTFGICGFESCIDSGAAMFKIWTRKSWWAAASFLLCVRAASRRFKQWGKRNLKSATACGSKMRVSLPLSACTLWTGTTC